jgi:hypothetical protein
MKISRRQATIGGVTLLAGTSMGTSAQAQRDRPLKRAIEDVNEQKQVSSAERLTPKELASRTVYRRAVDAVIWGLPLVGEDAVKQAAFRDGNANYNDIVWWPKGGGWKNQSPTPNVNTRYMYFFINTKQSGPVVVELPPAVPGASFYGTIEDAWYVPLTDIGFEGKGGKYLVLPPGYDGNVPDGYTPVRPATYNTMTLLRSILASLSEKDEQAGNELVKQVKIYPLSKADNPPAQRLLDMTEVMYNGLVKYDETFFTSLARMLNEETVQPRDLQMMGMLLPLGIERSKEFKPDAATVAQLNAAAAEAHAWLMDKAATDVTPWWPDSQWCVPSPPITVPTEFKWETPNYFGVDARAIALSQYFCPTAKLGTGSFYFASFHRQERRTVGGREQLPAARSSKCACARVLVRNRLQSENVELLSQRDAPHTRFARQGIAQERRRDGGHLLWPEATRRSAVQLALHPGRSEMVPLVPRVWPGEGDFRQELEIARY